MRSTAITSRKAPVREDVGVYRIGKGGIGPLDYLGQGVTAARWRSHAGGWALDLAAEDEGVWDWVGLSLGSRQLLEVENDLIASHMVVFARPPRVQFGGRGAVGTARSDRRRRSRA